MVPRTKRSSGRWVRTESNMRVWVLWLSVLAAVLHCSNGFTPGMEYEYKYKGKVYARFPGLEPAKFSGMAFKSHVTVQASATHAVVKISDVKFSKITKDVTDVNEHDYEYTEIPEMTEDLSRPVRVDYDKNFVYKSHHISHQDPAWAANFKRALLNFGHMELNPAKWTYPKDRKQLPKGLKDIPRYFRAMEETASGECEATYEISSEPSHFTPPGVHVLNVTKTVDHNNCVHTPIKMYTNNPAYHCVDCEVDGLDPLNIASISKFNIRLEGKKIEMEEIESIGEVQYAVFTDHGETVSVMINRTGRLLSEHPIKEAIPLPTDLEASTSFVYEHPEDRKFKTPVDLKQPNYLHDLFGYQAKVDDVIKEFQELVPHYDDESYKTAPKSQRPLPKFIELVRAFSTLNYDEIEQVFNAVANVDEEATEEQMSLRSLFYDVLIAAGSNPAFLYGKHLIETEKMPPRAVGHFIHSIPYQIKDPSEAILDEYYNMCDLPAMRNTYDLKLDCHLGFAALVYHSCEMPYHHAHHDDHHDSKDKAHCDEAIVTKHLQNIVNQYRNIIPVDSLRHIAFLKILGNFGTEGTIPILKPYLTGENDYPIYFRVAAAWALRRAVFFHPDEVLEIVVPVFFNHSEDHELRIAAFTTIMTSKPSQAMMDTIADSLFEEQSDHVVSYVNSVFEELANSTHPCHKKISKRAEKTLRILKNLEDEHPGLEYATSHAHILSGYDEEHGLGGVTRAAMIGSTNGYVPRSAYISVNNFMVGKSFETLSIGFNIYGAEKILDRFLGPEGYYRRQAMMDMFQRRHARDTNTNEKEIEDIDQKLHLKHKDYEPLFGNFFVKVFGNHVTFFHLNESLFKPDSDKMGTVFQRFAGMDNTYRRFLLGMNMLRVIPTDLGLPVAVDVKLPVMTFWKSNGLNLELHPSSFESDQPPTEIKLGLDGHLLIDRDVLVTVGIMMPVKTAEAGVGLSRRSIISLPIKTEFGVDLADRKYKVKWTPVPHEIYHNCYTPFIYRKYFNDHVPVTDETRHVPIVKKENMKEESKPLASNLLGLGLHRTLRYVNPWNDKGAWLDFMKGKDFRTLMYYFYANPHFRQYDYTISLDPPEDDVTTEVEAEFGLKHYGAASKDHTPYHSDHFKADDEVMADNKNTHIHVLSADFKTKGAKERTLNTETTYAHSDDKLTHKLNFFYDRSPLGSEETKHKQICATGTLKYPEVDLKKFLDLDVDDIDFTVHAAATVQAGDGDCHAGSKMVLKGTFSKTEEQTTLEAEKTKHLTEDYYNPIAYYYQECVKDRENGMFYSYHCEEYLYHVTLLHKYVIDMKTENVPDRLRKAIRKLNRVFKLKSVTHLELNDYKVQNEEGKFHLVANRSLMLPVWDVDIVKPYEEVKYHKVYVPKFRPLSSYPVEYTYWSEYIDKLEEIHFCTLYGDYVRTYDNLTVHLPDIKCQKLVSKDCSVNENFAILGTKTQFESYAKTMTAYIGKSKIELGPTSENSGVIVKIDGHRVAVTDDHPHTHETTRNDKEVEVFEITKHGEAYMIDSEPYGLHIVYGPHGFYIVPNDYYRGKLCGLCGDFNEDDNHEMKGPDGCPHHEVEHFAYSNAIPGTGCTIPPIHTECHH